MTPNERRCLRIAHDARLEQERRELSELMDEGRWFSALFKWISIVQLARKTSPESQDPVLTIVDEISRELGPYGSRLVPASDSSFIF